MLKLQKRIDGTELCDKLLTSRIILNATIPFEWKDKPTEVKLSRHIVSKVKQRWAEYGID